MTGRYRAYKPDTGPFAFQARHWPTRTRQWRARYPTMPARRADQGTPAHPVKRIRVATWGGGRVRVAVGGIV